MPALAMVVAGGRRSAAESRQKPRNGHLGHLEGNITAVADQLGFSVRLVTDQSLTVSGGPTFPKDGSCGGRPGAVPGGLPGLRKGRLVRRVSAGPGRK